MFFAGFLYDDSPKTNLLKNKKSPFWYASMIDPQCKTWDENFPTKKSTSDRLSLSYTKFDLVFVTCSSWILLSLLLEGTQEVLKK